MKNNKIKICILIERLNIGGAERSAGLLSIILYNLGYKVYFVVIFNDVLYPFAGELINLGKFKGGSRTILDKFLRYRKLKEVILEKDFDLILDFRMKDFALREVLLNKLVFKTSMINMVRSFNLEWYFSKYKILAKYLYKDYLGINTVSYKIQDEILKRYSFKNVTTIHNPIDLSYINEQAKEDILISDEFIIAAGRLAPVKQFDKLIEAYGNSVLPQKNIYLYIFGSGGEEKFLKEKIRTLNLSSKVRIIEFQENFFKFISKAKFLVLSSKHEGFPRVLIEALACNTPVVSFNCDSGPNEIIIHEVNGLLVDNQDFKSLTAAMNKMEIDKSLYKVGKKNAIKSIENFSMDVIGKQWDNYLKDLKLDRD